MKVMPASRACRTVPFTRPDRGPRRSAVVRTGGAWRMVCRDDSPAWWLGRRERAYFRSSIESTQPAFFPQPVFCDLSFTGNDLCQAARPAPRRRLPSQSISLFWCWLGPVRAFCRGSEEGPGGILPGRDLPSSSLRGPPPAHRPHGRLDADAGDDGVRRAVTPLQGEEVGDATVHESRATNVDEDIEPQREFRSASVDVTSADWRNCVVRG